MKMIRVVYGTTANKFWGVCGLIMHAAICSASQKTMPYEGIVRSKLTALSKVVNVQNEERSISLVARLRNDSFPKFLSRSFNGNIKQSNLTGFFTLNSSHAQNVVVGVAGLLKGGLASFGISVSKDNVVSPNFHFSLSMKRKKSCLSGMLKRMALREQESSEDLDVNSNVEKIFDLAEAIDTEQRRVKSTISSPKKCSENFPHLDILFKTMKKYNDSFSELKDEYMALQEDLDREKAEIMTNLFSENNELLILKQLQKELSIHKKNRRNFEKNKTRIDNIHSSMRDKIENYEKINIQRKHVKSMRSQQLNEEQLMITPQMIPFFQNLREGFIELKDFIENVLISQYKHDYSDFPLDAFYMPSHPRDLHKSFIDTFFSSEAKKRLKPFFQKKQEEMKQLENKLNFSESMREFSDNFLSLENLENNLGLECQLLGYVEIIENILKIYLYERNLEDQRKWCLTDNSSDLFLLLNNFRKRIDAFCTVADECISSGRVTALSETAKMFAKEQKMNLEKERRMLAHLFERQQKITRWKDVVMQSCEIEPELELAPPSWEQQ